MTMDCNLSRTLPEQWHRAERGTLITCPVPIDSGMEDHQHEVLMWMLDNEIVGGIYAMRWLSPRSIRWSIPDDNDRLVFALRWSGQY